MQSQILLFFISFVLVLNSQILLVFISLIFRWARPHLYLTLHAGPFFFMSGFIMLLEALNWSFIQWETGAKIFI